MPAKCVSNPFEYEAACPPENGLKSWSEVGAHLNNRLSEPRKLLQGMKLFECPFDSETGHSNGDSELPVENPLGPQSSEPEDPALCSKCTDILSENLVACICMMEKNIHF